MRISIFGVGYVGAVSSACLAAFGHDVVAVDVSAEKVALIASGRSPIVEAGMDDLMAQGAASGRLTGTTDVAAAIAGTDVSFISVGTPSAADGSVALDAVERVCASIGQALRAKAGPHVVVMRSTVPPGTAERLAIPILERESGRRIGEGLAYYANPEFLREGSSIRDFHEPPMTLIGAPEGDEASVLRTLYASLKAPVHVVPYGVAEGAKYLANVFHAVKIAFANECGAILAAHGVDARESFRIFAEDRVLNISPAYLRPGFAFGGSCLPKDVRSFLSLAGAANVAAPFLRQVLPSNEAVVERTFQAIARNGRVKVAMFGLAFKPGTDDLRESPFVMLAERLIGRGYELRIFDRFVQVARLVGTNRAYIEREIPHIERLMADSPDAALDGAEVVVVGHVAREDRPAMLAALAGRRVLDLSNMADLQGRSDIAYEGICW